MRGKALPSWGALFLLLFHVFLTHTFITCQTWYRANAGCYVHTVSETEMVLVEFRQMAHTEGIRHLGLTAVLHVSALGVE